MLATLADTVSEQHPQFLRYTQSVCVVDCAFCLHRSFVSHRFYAAQQIPLNLREKNGIDALSSQNCTYMLFANSPSVCKQSESSLPVFVVDKNCLNATAAQKDPNKLLNHFCSNISPLAATALRLPISSTRCSWTVVRLHCLFVFVRLTRHCKRERVHSPTTPCLLSAPYCSARALSLSRGWYRNNKASQ